MTERHLILPPDLKYLAALTAAGGVRYPGLVGVLIREDEHTVTAAASDHHAAVIATWPRKAPPAYEMMFPAIEAALPKGEPAVRVRLDPELLLRVLRAARPFAPDDGFVTLEVYSGHTTLGGGLAPAVMVRSKPEGGGEFTAAVICAVRTDPATGKETL